MFDTKQNDKDVNNFPMGFCPYFRTIVAIAQLCGCDSEIINARRLRFAEQHFQ